MQRATIVNYRKGAREPGCEALRLSAGWWSEEKARAATQADAAVPATAPVKPTN